MTQEVVPTYTEPGRIYATRTKLSEAQAREAFTAALRLELHRDPTPAELCMLLAQSAFETADWSSMFCWNFGNSVVGGSGAKWFTLKDDADRAIEKRHHYRVFDSATQGAAYYVHLLHARFTKAWPLIGSGDTHAFAAALKAQSYYEATLEHYAAGLAQKYARLSHAVA